jgi:hypothetical protein
MTGGRCENNPPARQSVALPREAFMAWGEALVVGRGVPDRSRDSSEAQVITNRHQHVRAGRINHRAVAALNATRFLPSAAGAMYYKVAVA